MIKVKAKNGQSMGFAVVTGCVSAILVSLLLTIGLTSLILNGSLSESRTGLIAFLIRVLSVFLGCLIAGGICKERVLPVIGLIAGGYLITILVIGIIAFDGSFHNFLSGILSVLLGSVLAFVLRVMPKKRATHGAYRIK